MRRIIAGIMVVTALMLMLGVFLLPFLHVKPVRASEPALARVMDALDAANARADLAELNADLEHLFPRLKRINALEDKYHIVLTPFLKKAGTQSTVVDLMTGEISRPGQNPPPGLAP
jgi:hypothetical protein